MINGKAGDLFHKDSPFRFLYHSRNDAQLQEKYHSTVSWRVLNQPLRAIFP